MRRGKAIFKWLCILAGGMLVLLLVLAAGFYWMAGRPLAKRLAELREAGEPVCLADLERAVPANDNGALYLMEAKAELESAEKEIYAIKEPENGKYPPEDRVKIHKILEDHPKILPFMQKAAAAPDFQFPLDYHVKPSQFISDYLPISQIKRSGIRFLKNQADDLLNEGKREEALQTALLMLQLARQYDRDCPILISYQMNIACKQTAMQRIHEVLQSGPIEEKQHTALDVELARLDSLDACHASIKTERAYCLDAMENDMPNGMLAFQRSQWKLCALEMFEDFHQFSLQPYSTGVSKANRQPQSMVGAALRGPAALMLPASKACLEASFRLQAMARSLRIINALERTPLTGEKIPSMAELGLPKEVGIDPFNGQTMIVKKTPVGWLVYSVGQNLQNDGGKLGVFLDVGFGPKKYMAEEEEKEADAKKTTQ